MLQPQLNQVESSWSRPLDRMQPNIDWSPWWSTEKTRASFDESTVKPRLAQIRWRSFFVAAAAGCAQGGGEE